MKSKLILFGMLISIIVVAGCAGSGGHVTGGYYTSPHDNFTVPIPKMGPGARVQDKSFENGGFVSFHDDFGRLLSINFDRLPGDTDIILRDLIHDTAIPNMLSQFPGIKILHEEPLNTDGVEEYFIVFKIPEGSTMLDMKAGKRMDSTRGFLYFISGGWGYVLSTQQGSVFDLLTVKEKVEPPTQESFDKLLNNLKEFKNTMQIKSLTGITNR